MITTMLMMKESLLNDDDDVEHDLNLMMMFERHELPCLGDG
jgi:hypothetical protein